MLYSFFETQHMLLEPWRFAAEATRGWYAHPFSPFSYSPLSRRIYLNSAVSWRRNEPLITNGLRLKSFWFETSVGYAVEQWVAIEGFYQAEHQVIDRPGGTLGRNRVGFQIVTSKPVRIH